MCVCSVVSNSFATAWTAAHQAPLSMGFPRQEYWSRLLFPFPGDFSHTGIKPVSLETLALGGRFFTTVPPGKPCNVEFRILSRKRREGPRAVAFSLHQQDLSPLIVHLELNSSVTKIPAPTPSTNAPIPLRAKNPAARSADKGGRSLSLRSRPDGEPRGTSEWANTGRRPGQRRGARGVTAVSHGSCIFPYVEKS